jgi:hypothetical protein
MCTSKHHLQIQNVTQEMTSNSNLINSNELWAKTKVVDFQIPYNFYV